LVLDHLKLCKPLYIINLENCPRRLLPTFSGEEAKEEVIFRDFSKGMKQRALLAQALFTKPKQLILDEPFSGLDPVGCKEIRDPIVKYNKDYNTTVFISSHILADVAVMCDSIGILDKGELKALGEKDELSAFIAQTKDPEKITNLFKKYVANDIRVIKHSRNLEDLSLTLSRSNLRT